MDAFSKYAIGSPTVSRELGIQVLEESKELRLARI
jgi:hypothetical protein